MDQSDPAASAGQPHKLYDAADPRIYFAAERTHLAWVRTGLAMMGFGFVVARFGLFLRELAAAQRATAEGLPPHTPGLSLYVGVTLVGLGVAVTLAASIKYRRRIGRLQRGEPVTPKPASLELIVGAVLALVGLAMAAYLLGIVGTR
jgi:putative membrane protein